MNELAKIPRGWCVQKVDDDTWKVRRTTWARLCSALLGVFVGLPMLGSCLFFVYGVFFRPQIFPDVPGWWPWAMLPFMLLVALVIAGAWAQVLIDEGWTVRRNELVVRRSLLFFRWSYTFSKCSIRLTSLELGNLDNRRWYLRIFTNQDEDLGLGALALSFLIREPLGGMLTVEGRKDELISLGKFLAQQTGWTFHPSKHGKPFRPSSPPSE